MKSFFSGSQPLLLAEKAETKTKSVFFLQRKTQGRLTDEGGIAAQLHYHPRERFATNALIPAVCRAPRRAIEEDASPRVLAQRRFTDVTSAVVLRGPEPILHYSITCSLGAAWVAGKLL